MPYAVKIGETGKELTVRFRHSNGAFFDLTGATVTLLVASQAPRAVAIVSAAEGIAKYVTVAGDYTTDWATPIDFTFAWKVANGGLLYLSADDTLAVEAVT